jgi:hypothetical protein
MTKIASPFLGPVLLALALTGCAGSPADVDPAQEQTHTVGDGYLCSFLPISREAVETRVPVSEMGEPGRTAFAEAVWDDGSPVHLPPDEDWYVATVSNTLVGVMRDLEVQDDPTSLEDPPDREILVLRWVADATNLAPGWYVDQSDTCALTVDVGDLTVPAIELESAPDPAATEVRLLVTEQSCNSGQDAEGRIEIVSLEENEDRVSLILGVRPRDGGQNCPSNPATPFIVSLSEPLGTREVVNASLADPRPLTVNTPHGEALAEGSDCEHTSLMFHITPSTVTAGQTVAVTTTPEDCPITEALAGEVIVRLGNGDTATGTRIEMDSPQPVTVSIPPGLAGTGFIMLVPDQDCVDVLSTADCHYPFADITIEAPSP